MTDYQTGSKGYIAYKTHTLYGTKELKVKGWKISHANINQKKAEVAVLTSDLGTRSIIRNREIFHNKKSFTRKI